MTVYDQVLASLHRLQQDVLRALAARALAA